MSKKKIKQLLKYNRYILHRLESIDDRLIDQKVTQLRINDENEKRYKTRHFRSIILKLVIISFLALLSYYFRQDIGILVNVFNLLS